MSAFEFKQLPNEHRQLLNKFYRDQRSPMRTSQGATLWVARDADAIIAGLNLTPIEQGAWLTGLLVASEQRGRQVARRLVDTAASSIEGPLWLFCHPDLQVFYQALGWTVDPLLPTTLEERLHRYRQNKFLLAMERHPGLAC